MNFSNDIIDHYWVNKRRCPVKINQTTFKLHRYNSRYDLRPYYFDQKLQQKHIKRKREFDDELLVRRKIIKTVQPVNIPKKDTSTITFQKSIDEDVIFSWNNFTTSRYDIDKYTEHNWVSATKIANYLLHDPVLDWYQKYFDRLGYNMQNTKDIKDEKAQSTSYNICVPTNKTDTYSLKLLFEMGNKFEKNVVEFLKKKFGDNVKTVHTCNIPIHEYNMDLVMKYMSEGVPIIDQAPLYNEVNRTYGIADLVVRSDWVNKIISSRPISEEDEHRKAPNLNGNYHYVVIDIKWTTMTLCANGKTIRNDGRFPAYKGQLAIYNSIVGKLQGYTSNVTYILAKSYKYTKNGNTIQGYNCFDILGHVDYNDFDNKYIKLTYDAVNWIKYMRLNGSEWSLIPPSVPELYPNICNLHDNMYKQQKKHQAEQIKELTSIYMVGYKNRLIGHKNNIYRYDDPNCTARSLGITGDKVSFIVDQFLKMENNTDPEVKIKPRVICNNANDWQHKSDIEFFVDFEMLNTQFYTKNINLSNSQETTDFLFMVGIGYEEDDKFKYKCFYANKIDSEEEIDVVTKFINFIECKVSEHMKKYNILDRKLCTPKLFHWSFAEPTTVNHIISRHKDNAKFVSDWLSNMCWVDYCKVFKDEPIILKGVKSGFSLKHVARQMYENGWISTMWKETGPLDGFSAMLCACEYYKNKEQHKHMFNSIIDYNHVDCKVVWEIVNYFRRNNANETFKDLRLQGLLNDFRGETEDSDMMFPEAEEVNESNEVL